MCLKIWTIEGYEGYNSTNTSAVVVADNEREAAFLLTKTLKEKGLPHSVIASKFSRVRQGGYNVRILGNESLQRYHQWLLNQTSYTENIFSIKDAMLASPDSSNAKLFHI